jgi:hypothetical protein
MRWCVTPPPLSAPSCVPISSEPYTCGKHLWEIFRRLRDSLLYKYKTVLTKCPQRIENISLPRLSKQPIVIMPTTHDDVDKDRMAIQLEEADVLGKQGGDNSPEMRIDQKMERKALLKLDLLLVSLMCSLYLLAFLDRANIGNARVAGLQTDLGISDHQYQIGKSRYLPT